MKVILLVSLTCAFQLKDKKEEGNKFADLESIMNKYDDNEAKANAPAPEKPVPKGGPSASDIQDMELKILQGNNLAESSQKADDDDYFQDLLSRHSSDRNGDKILLRADAKEACLEIYEKNKESDPFKAPEQLNGIFGKMWNDHDIHGNGFIDLTEAYNLF